MEGIDEQALRKEQGDIRWRLLEIEKLLEEKEIAPMSDACPRVSIPLSRENHAELQRIAREASTSLAALGQLAVRHLILQARSGALPMLPPASLETAQAVDALGRPLGCPPV